MTEKAKESAELERDPLHEVRERFKRAKDAWHDDRQRYVEDSRFLQGEHWDDKAKKMREDANRPCLVVDKLNQYVRQVVNDSRQNRPSIKVRPVDNEADVETAEVLQGMCRHIEERSNADTAYDTALESAVKGGFGFFRILTEYAHDKTFDQELCIKRVRNPLTVLFDPDCQEPDGSDARFCFVFEELDCSDFEAQYPGKAKAPLDDEKYSGWADEEKVVVAEYWEVVETDKTVHLLADGSVCDDDEYQTAIAEGLTPPPIEDTRTLPTRTLKWGKCNGKEWLEPQQDRPGKWIPVIPVWGNEADIDGKVIHTSMIHNSKDAQRLYDYSRSAFAERVALTPKAPYIAADGQVENYEEDWAMANQSNIGVLKYTPVDVAGTPVPPPQRQLAQDIPAGFAQDMSLSEHDIQSSLGMYNASLGEKSNEKSGRAILARQKEGDITNFHYHDNLARAIRHGGRILIDLIPKIYDSTRIVRVLGMDGKAEMVQLDPTLPVASGKMNGSKVFNIGVGTYDVAVSAGPSYTTRRQEAAESMAQLTQANPDIFPVIGDLMIRSMDWPMSEEIADRLKAMLPPQIQQLEKQEDGPSPEVLAIMQQAEQAIAEHKQGLAEALAEIQRLQAENEAMKADQQAKQAELAIKAQETQIKAFDAETKRMQVIVSAEQKTVAEQPAEPQEPQEPQESIGEVLKTIADMKNPIHVGVPDPGAAEMTLQAASQINQAVEALTLVAAEIAKPKHKTGRAVKQPDGSYVMESIEEAVNVN